MIPVSIVIPTLGNDSLKFCLSRINSSVYVPQEVLVVIPISNLKNLKVEYSEYKNLRIKIVSSPKKNQVYQRIIGFKKSKSKILMQLDDDILVEKNCLYNLFKFLKKKKQAAVAPKYVNRNRLSIIYKKPQNKFLKFYHWLINSSDGYSPGKVAVSGFNYAEENKSKGSSLHQWLSGGAVMHHKKNLILKNYYPYKFSKCFCEDILHSLILRQKGIKLFKYFDAKVSEKSQGNIVIKSDMLKSLKNLYSEYLIRKFIVEKFELSKTRMNIYYLIFLLRILIRIIR